jgi:hypothetical protein
LSYLRQSKQQDEDRRDVKLHIHNSQDYANQEVFQEQVPEDGEVELPRLQVQ